MSFPHSDQQDLPIRVLRKFEDLLHYLVAIAMILLAGFVLFRAVADFFEEHDNATRVIGAINSVLFVVIVLELLVTVLAHFHDEGFQLTPFLIIGGISAVRHILTIGAQQSLGKDDSATTFDHVQIELGVNAGVALVMVVALVLVRRFRADQEEHVAAVDPADHGADSHH